MPTNNAEPKPTIIDDVGADLLASEIVKVSQAAQALLKSRLTERAIILLIQDASGVTRGDIQSVLRAAANLERAFIKPAPKVEASNG